MSASPAVNPVILPASLMVTLPNLGLSANSMFITPSVPTDVRIFWLEAAAVLAKPPWIFWVSPSFLVVMPVLPAKVMGFWISVPMLFNAS